jgi:quercetin dioxygenase-like cupin family protein
MVTLAAGDSIGQSQLPSNEHWLVCDGVLHLTLGDQPYELYKGDVALLRTDLVRHVGTSSGARAILVRERTPSQTQP